MSSPPTPLRPYLHKIAERRDLSRAEAREAFGLIMEGEASDAEIAALLMGLRVKGECADELTGGAEALRERALRIPAPPGAVDTCGTGGDGHATLNVSTAAAIVVAACGVPVAKHGNRAVSSRSGSADVLEALGVATDIPPQRAQACLEKLGICFLLASRHHNAVRHVMPVRRMLAIRTIFNMLGPLANPAETRRQVIGVFDPAWLEPFARTLMALGSERVWVVHGRDGVDELSIAGPTDVVAVDGSELRRFSVSPEDAALARHPLEAIRGGSAAENARALRALLAGKPGAYRDIVLLNAAAALVVAGRAGDLAKGVRIAAQAIDSGAAAALLARWARLSHGEAPEGTADG
ncbi:MAG: anthranilate phosphoribosyltransferase [Rhodothalassiaceae bacterium]